MAAASKRRVSLRDQEQFFSRNLHGFQNFLLSVTSEIFQTWLLAQCPCSMWVLEGEHVCLPVQGQTWGLFSGFLHAILTTVARHSWCSFVERAVFRLNFNCPTESSASCSCGGETWWAWFGNFIFEDFFHFGLTSVYTSLATLQTFSKLLAGSFETLIVRIPTSS